MRWAAVAVLPALTVGACADLRVTENASRIGPTLASVQFDQIKDQLAKAVDDPYSLPSFAFVGSGTTASGDSVSGNFMRVANPMIVTRTLGLTVGAATNTYTYTFTAVTNVDALGRGRDLFAYAVTGSDADWKSYFARLVYPPPHGRWLHADSVPPGGVFLGRYGGHALWATSAKEFDDFSLAVLSALRTSGVFKGEKATVRTAPASGKRPSGNAPAEQGSPSLAPGPSILVVPQAGATQ